MRHNSFNPTLPVTYTGSAQFLHHLHLKDSPLPRDTKVDPPTVFFQPPYRVFSTGLPCFFDHPTVFFQPPYRVFSTTLPCFFDRPTVFFRPPYRVFPIALPCFFRPPYRVFSTALRLRTFLKLQNWY